MSESEVDAMKALLIDKVTMAKIKKTAMSVCKKIQPPFNTDVKRGGWSDPKWIIEMPSIDAIVATKVEQYKKANNDREPNASLMKKFQDEAKVYG
ncbi:MAG: hypothetical protein MZV65_45005 [Chromatiales bacterium]|nr:hypothetical protein [Chromatiales bacterium]